MGCPDWPKCFGQWIPPTHVSQLPENYQEIYAHRGYENEPFNAVKTWTEYINRLVGVTVGFLVIGAVALSLGWWRADRLIPLASLFALFMTGFAGWLGKIVVEQNLSPVTVSIHMISALLIVSALIYAIARAGKYDLARIDADAVRPVALLTLACLALTVIQFSFGVQVRQGIDAALAALGADARTEWLAETGILFYIHRSFSIVVLGANAVLAYGVCTRARQVRQAIVAVCFIMGAIIFEIASGAILYYGGFPAPLQPPHLLLATVLFGAQLSLWLTLRYSPLSRIVQSPSPSP